MENPVLNDNEAASLLAQAAQADASDATSSVEPQPEDHAAGTEDDHAADNATAPKVDGEHSDNTEPKPAEQPQKEQKQPPEAKAETPFEKAKKDAARRDESWKKLNEEKEALRKERDEFQRQRDQRPRQTESTPDIKDERGFTAAEYEEAAKGFEAEGEIEMATQAKARANALKQQEANAARQGRRQQFEGTRKADLAAVIKAHPEFAPGGAKAQQMESLLGEFPELDALPNCFTRAVQLFQLREEAGQVPGLKERVAKAAKEIERLTRLTSINGGSPSQPSSPTAFDKLSLSAQEAELMRMAEAADRG